MKIARTIHEMRHACAQARVQAKAAIGSNATLGLVPTMGALHEGHLSLIRTAKQQCSLVAATIFVNPTQFGPNEDFSRYPRTFEADCTLLKNENVDILFAPTVEEMYPHGNTSRTYIEVLGIGDRLDGASRPGHFRGVATVVAKLFHIATPDRAFFGQKDAAQVAVLRAMVSDLDFPLELVVCPTRRDPDGLALSSRNKYLTPEQRTQALALSQSLNATVALASQGTQDATELRAFLHDRLVAVPGIKLDYAEIVDPNTLESIPNIRNGALIAVAAWVGTTRLIDNVLLPAK
jgi:pantoate--beta-alanine ligase